MTTSSVGLPRWVVHVIDPAIGIGKRLGDVSAADHRAAELVAANRFPGQSLFVSLAGGRALEVFVNGNHVEVIGSIRSELDRNIFRDQCAVALATNPTALVIDFAQAKYVDTGALATLVRIARRCADQGCQLQLEGVSDDLRVQLSVTKIDTVIATINAINDRAKRKGAP